MTTPEQQQSNEGSHGPSRPEDQRLAVPLFTQDGSGHTSDVEAYDSSASAVQFTQYTSTAYGGLSSPRSPAELQKSVVDTLCADAVFIQKFDSSTLEPLNAGGQGLVFKVLHREMKQMVAIKVSPPSTSMKATFLQRFQREAQTLRTVTHDNLVRVYDFHITERNNLAYIEMELLGNDTLQKAIEECSTESNFQSGEKRRLLEYFTQVCSAVDTLHQNDILHRDLKPQNVMLHGGRNAVAKVIDLGVQKSVGQEEDPLGGGPLLPHSQLTQLGRAVGTFDYMAPEQRKGEATRESDIYGLGGILCGILMNRTPRAYLENPSDPQIPAELRSILHKCLAAEPKDRYASALEVKEDVNNWLTNNEVSAYTRSLSTPSLAWYRIRRVVEGAKNKIVDHPTVSASILGVLLFCGYAAKRTVEHNREVAAATQKELSEQERLSSLIEKAIEKERDAKQRAHQNRVGEAIEVAQSLLQELSSDREKNVRIEQLYSSMESLLKDWQLLEQLRDVTIRGQEKRVNSFVLGEFAPLDIQAFIDVAKIYLPNGLTEEAIPEFVRKVNSAAYSTEQREEIIKTVVESWLVKHCFKYLVKEDLSPELHAQKFNAQLEEAKYLKQLFRSLYPTESREYVPSFIAVMETTALSELGRNAEILKHEYSLGLGSGRWANIHSLGVALLRSNFPLDKISQTAGTIQLQGTPAEMSVVDTSSLAMCILACQQGVTRYLSETEDEGRVKTLLQVLPAYRQLTHLTPKNPHAWGQFGRVALAVAILEEYKTPKDRSLLGCRVIACEAFDHYLALQPSDRTSDLVFDTSRALWLRRVRAGEALEMMESARSLGYENSEEVDILEQGVRAFLAYEVNLEFANQLSQDESLIARFPIESSLVFARAQVQEPDKRDFWEQRLQYALNRLGSKSPGLDSVVAGFTSDLNVLRQRPVQKRAGATN